MLRVVAAAASNVPFAISGGALVAWVVLLALTGLRRPTFVDDADSFHVVLDVTGVLVVCTLVAAVAGS
jgi:hypothetical protein